MPRALLRRKRRGAHAANAILPLIHCRRKPFSFSTVTIADFQTSQAFVNRKACPRRVANQFRATPRCKSVVPIRARKSPKFPIWSVTATKSPQPPTATFRLPCPSTATPAVRQSPLPACPPPARPEPVRPRRPDCSTIDVIDHQPKSQARLLDRLGGKARCVRHNPCVRCRTAISYVSRRAFASNST